MYYFACFDRLPIQSIRLAIRLTLVNRDSVTEAQLQSLTLTSDIRIE